MPSPVTTALDALAQWFSSGDTSPADAVAEVFAPVATQGAGESLPNWLVRKATGQPDVPLIERGKQAARFAERIGPTTRRASDEGAIRAAMEQWGQSGGAMTTGTIADFERANLPKLAEVYRALAKKFPRLMRSIDYRPDESLMDEALNAALGETPMAEWRPPHPNSTTGQATVGVSPALERAEPGPFGGDPRLGTFVHELMHHAHAKKYGTRRFLTAYDKATMERNYVHNPWELLAEAAAVKRTTPGPMDRALSIREAAARRVDQTAGGMRPENPLYQAHERQMNETAKIAQTGAKRYLPRKVGPLRTLTVSELGRKIGADKTGDLYHGYARVTTDKPTNKGFFEWLQTDDAAQYVEGDILAETALVEARKLIAGRRALPSRSGVYSLDPRRAYDLKHSLDALDESRYAHSGRDGGYRGDNLYGDEATLYREADDLIDQISSTPAALDAERASLAEWEEFQQQHAGTPLPDLVRAWLRRIQPEPPQ